MRIVFAINCALRNRIGVAVQSVVASELAAHEGTADRVMDLNAELLSNLPGSKNVRTAPPKVLAAFFVEGAESFFISVKRRKITYERLVRCLAAFEPERDIISFSGTNHLKRGYI